MKKSLFILVICYMLSVVFLAGNVSAQSLSLSISPPLLEVMIKPNKTITQVYKLINTGDSVIITPKLYELGFFGISEDSKFSREKWISIVSNDIDFDKPFILGAGKEADFLLKIGPPATAVEQDYYRALVFSTTPNIPSDSTVSMFSQNLASPLLITVTKSGIFAKAAQVINFKMPKILDSFDPLRADIDIKNTGSTYFRPVGNLTLTGPIGHGTYDLIPSAILSGQTKKLLTADNPSQNLKDKTLILPGFYVGKYKLELNFTLDEGTGAIKDVRTFYAIPWKIGLVIFILAGISLKIRNKKKPRNNNQETNTV